MTAINSYSYSFSYTYSYNNNNYYYYSCCCYYYYYCCDYAMIVCLTLRLSSLFGLKHVVLAHVTRKTPA